MSHVMLIPVRRPQGGQNLVEAATAALREEGLPRIRPDISETLRTANNQPLSKIWCALAHVEEVDLERARQHAHEQGLIDKWSDKLSRSQRRTLRTVSNPVEVDMPRHHKRKLRMALEVLNSFENTR